MRVVPIAIVCLAACAPTASGPSLPLTSSTPVVSETVSPSPSPSPIVGVTALPSAPTSPKRSVVTLYRVDDVLRGAAQPSKRLNVNAPVYQMQFGPDARQAIVSNVGDGSVLRVLDLETGAVASFALGLPADALVPQRSIIGWLPDGRLLVTGREIWIGGTRGEDLRSVFARFPLEVVPSPSGRLLAIRPLDSSSVVVLDLFAGTATTVAGPFRPCVQDGGIGIVWAPDDRFLAATDCSDEAQGGMQTRFVGIADGREFRSLAGLSISAWLPGGNVIARGPFQPRAERQIFVVTLSGARRSLPSFGFYASPDARFLLGSGVRDAPTAADPARREHFAQLVEIATGRVVDIGEGMPMGWTSRGEIVLVGLM